MKITIVVMSPPIFLRLFSLHISSMLMIYKINNICQPVLHVGINETVRSKIYWNEKMPDSSKNSKFSICCFLLFS